MDIDKLTKKQKIALAAGVTLGVVVIVGGVCMYKKGSEIVKLNNKILDDFTKDVMELSNDIISKSDYSKWFKKGMWGTINAIANADENNIVVRSLKVFHGIKIKKVFK